MKKTDAVIRRNSTNFHATEDSNNGDVSTLSLQPNIIIPEKTFIKYFILRTKYDSYVQKAIRSSNPGTLIQSNTLFKTLLEFDD